MNPPKPDTLDLLLRHAGGDASEAECAELSRRLAEDPAARAAMCDLALEAFAVAEQAAAAVPIGLATPIPMRRPVADWRRWTLPIAALLIAAAMVGGLIGRFRADPEIVRIQEITGEVRWTGSGGRTVEAPPMHSSLRGGALETLSDGASVTVEFHDGSALTLTGRSTATISDDGQKSIDLREGSLSADVRPQPRGKPLLIHTPTAAMEVVGTRFDVESASASTRLNVNEGAVRLTRLVDGSVIEVPADYQAVASLVRGEKMASVKRAQPVIAWQSDLSRGGNGMEGEWLPPAAGAPARLKALPRLLNKTSRGRVIIYTVGLGPSSQGLTALQMQPDARLRVSGTMSRSVPVEMMLNTRSPRGGFAGNFFRQATPEAGSWQIEAPVSAFRRDRADGDEPLREPLNLNWIAIYTIDADAGLEIEKAELTQAAAP